MTSSPVLSWCILLGCTRYYLLFNKQFKFKIQLSDRDILPFIHLLKIFTSWFLHGHFFIKTLLSTESPTCGSFMSTSAAMIAKFFLPRELLNLLPSLMWRRPFTSHSLSCYHSLLVLNNHMVMQATKTTWFFMPWFLLKINNMLVIKMN